MFESPPSAEAAAYVQNFLSASSLSQRTAARISAVLIGSAADKRRDSFSDWDIHLFCRGIDLGTIVPDRGETPFVDDKSHDPPVFMLIRGFDFLERQFSRDCAINLWIYQHGVVLRDDDEHFAHYLSQQERRFASGLSECVWSKYVSFRSSRHSLDAACKRNDEATVSLLAAETVSQALQLAHLVHRKPYPRTQWLFWSLTNDPGHNKLSHAIGFAARALLDANVSTAMPRSRLLADQVQKLLSSLGYSDSQLIEWWAALN